MDKNLMPLIDPIFPKEITLRDYALSYPEAHEEFPWGDRVIKVRKKVFVFLGRNEECVNLSVKLPHSHLMALMLPFVEPTGYGLGKSGWVTARFETDEELSLEMVRLWIDESYRAIAPKTLVKMLSEGKVISK